MIIQVGLVVKTNSGTNGDGGVASGPPTAATVYVDSFWVE